jgi:hypothetical protein
MSYLSHGPDTQFLPLAREGLLVKWQAGPKCRSERGRVQATRNCPARVDFTRLTNNFSKKWENHWAAVACWFAFYNFCRFHKSLRTTPAMAAGISDHIWSVRELLETA